MYKSRIGSKQGLSLIELIIASVMVGICLLGILGVDFAIRGSRQSAASDARLAMQTWATVTHITSNAKQAVGNATDMGIKADELNNYLCVRHNQTQDPSNDIWVCYSKFANQIHTCERAAVGPCNVSDESIGTYATKDACVTDCDLFTYNIVADSINQRLYLELSLTNRPDPTAPSDPTHNPDYTVQTRVSPDGHSYSP